MEHGSGVILAFLFVVTVLHGCGANSACASGTTAAGASHDRTSAREETGRTNTCRSTRQDHAAESDAPARNESEWSFDRHSCPREAGEVGWQR